MKVFTLVLGMVAVAVAVVAAAQAPAQKPKFEVASIKPTHEVPPYGMNFNPSGVTAHAQVNTMIVMAYGITVRQLQGDSPVLLESFDIDARAVAGFTLSTRAPVDIYVVDHVERPVAN